MSEGKNNTASVSDLFEKLIQQKAREDLMSRVQLNVADEKDEALAREFMALPSTASWIERGMKSKIRTVGLVIEVKKADDQTHIQYIDQYGMPMGFVYTDGANYFKDAPEGFSVGDIILNQTNGGVMESVKPLNLKQETRVKVLTKIKGAFDGYASQFENKQ